MPDEVAGDFSQPFQRNMNGDMPVTNDPQVGKRASSVLEKGPFVVALLSRLESAGHRVVYLRNYEHLPDDIGNDVDLLIERGHTQAVVEMFCQQAPEYGWRVWKCVPFSCLSVFLISDTDKEIIHVDLFEQVEWHFFAYADPEAILSRRIWSGLVFKPSLADEIYLNLATRLIYHGIVRDKHRQQWEASKGSLGSEALASAFCPRLLGSVAEDLFQAASASDWPRFEALHRRFRRAIVLHCMKRPWHVIGRVFAYLRRGISRIVGPPGVFIVFTGFDGEGRSTAIQQVVSLLEEFLGAKETLFFNWKPTARSVSLGGTNLSSPRGSNEVHPRSPVGSPAFLVYHWLTFWAGYTRYILPKLARNRLVVADRFACDVWLDPHRFRLNTPEWLLKVFVKTLPKPNVALALLASPEAILERKQEFEPSEIEAYQGKIKSGNISYISIVDADPQSSVVADRCFQEILRLL